MNPFAATLLTLLLSGAPQEKLDHARLEHQAASGDKQAVHTLCYSQLYGTGLPQNHGDAFLWCEKGANLGIASSQTLLAEMYRFGYHVPKDDREARRWYSAAAEQGHVHAQLMLGRLIFENATTASEGQEACRWFLAAADAGYEKAKVQLEQLDEWWLEHHAGNPPRANFCKGK